ncbi:MAG TPA: hypothetical protein VEY71_09225, partial [Chitinophagales bacterium]|nr:hypothetical protein [Chitinophagales bacterium]
MKRLLFLIVSSLCAFAAQASHMVAGEITYKHLGALDYEVTVVFYKDCGGFVDMGTELTIASSSVSLGLGTSHVLNAVVMDLEVSNICPSQIANTTCNGGSGTLPGVWMYVYKGTVTLPNSATDWVFLYEDCCRNAAITNIGTPDSYGYRLEAHLNTALPSNSSPTFAVLPLPTIYANAPYQYSYAGIDPDGDSLVYTLTDPIDWLSGSLIPYLTPFSPTYPLSTTTGAVSFNSQTGEIDFVPNATQVTVFAIKVEEYRFGQLIGSVHRDIQLVVVNGVNGMPTFGGLQNVTGSSLASPNTLAFC